MKECCGNCGKCVEYMKLHKMVVPPCRTPGWVLNNSNYTRKEMKELPF